MTLLTPQDIERLTRFSLDHAGDGVFWVDADGALLYANDAAGRAVGYAPAELMRLTLFQLSPELTQELWEQLRKEVRARQEFAFEFTLKAKDNRVFSVEMNVFGARPPAPEVLCAFFRDVNERKRLQQLKNEFVSTVSHELRTPITIIRESVSQIVDGLCGEVPASQREALYITLSGIDRLARIINDLLDVSKMEAGKAVVRWERLDLVELIREVVETFAPRAKERGLLLHPVLPLQPVIAYADYDRIVQVFTNLIGNALKFSEKGKIEIFVRERDSEIECAVADSGIGIATEDLGKVFNKFEQLSRPAVTGEKGSGLGLSICKSIVEMHQGRIGVESQPGRGTTFTFALPRRTAKDLFRQKIAGELAQAALTGGNLTAAVLTLRLTSGSTPAPGWQRWALEELMETVRGQGVRKTDIVLKDAEAVWLGLLNMTVKESARIIDKIGVAFAGALQKQGLAEQVGVAVRRCSYPEASSSETEFMQRLFGVDGPDAG